MARAELQRVTGPAYTVAPNLSPQRTSCVKATMRALATRQLDVVLSYSAARSEPGVFRQLPLVSNPDNYGCLTLLPTELAYIWLLTTLRPV